MTRKEYDEVHGGYNSRTIIDNDTEELEEISLERRRRIRESMARDPLIRKGGCDESWYKNN